MLGSNTEQTLLHLLFLSSTTRIRTLFRSAIYTYLLLFLFVYLLQQIDQLLFVCIVVMWLGNVRSSVYFVFDKRFFFFRYGFSTFE